MPTSTCPCFPLAHGRLHHRLPLALPWFFSGGRDTQRRLMRAEQARRGRPSWPATALWIAAWGLVAPHRIALALWKNGRIATIGPGTMSLGRQALALFSAYFADNITPLYFYRFRLYRPDRWRQRASYIYGWQCGALLLKPAGRRPGFGNDKFAFWSACRHRDLPTAPVLAAYRGANWLGGDLGADVPWPKIDLVLKDASAEAGKRIEVWVRRGDAEGWTTGREQATEAELRARLQRRSRVDRVWLVQPFLENDPAMHLPPDLGLANARIATLRYPDGRIALLAASHRIPTRGPGLVINMVLGHLIAPIDLVTGRLGPAESAELWRGHVTHHPDTGRAFAGEVLPHWEEARALALRAHEAFADFPFVGWDVVFTRQGVLLLELNPGSSGFLLQLDGQPPLGQTIVIGWYEAWREARSRARPRHAGT